MKRIFNWNKFNESVGSISIANYDRYIERMDMSTQDKLFFLNKVEFDVIVDFGCANGSLLYSIQKLKPNVKIIGFDVDDEMVSKSKQKLGSNALVTASWEEVLNELSKYKNPLLNLSSVIHEVYSYNSTKEVMKFWRNAVFGNLFKYIVIRDMMPSSKVDMVDPNTFLQDTIEVKKKYDPHFMKTFENEWGNIEDSYRIFIHFLLKYRYTDNWDRELIENYVPVSFETVKKKIPSNYKILMEDNFILPYIQSQCIKDFGIKIKYPTHCKLIIENTLM